MENNSSNYLTAIEIQKKVKEIGKDFTFQSKLMIINQIIKIASNKKPYLELRLRDISGIIGKVRKWSQNGNDHLEDRDNLDLGNVIAFTGQYDNNWKSITIQNYRKIDEKEYNTEEFIKFPVIDKLELVKMLDNSIKNIKNKHLNGLLNKIFTDENVRNKFITLPSSVGNHHAYKHGNLQHTMGMVNLFNNLIQYYESDTLLDIDLTLAGILLHDIAKIKEYNLKNGFSIYINKELSDHLRMGRDLVLKFIKEIKDFPKDLENRLIHLIISHHGKVEWDALVEPQTPEAEMLHLLDMIDSRFKLNY